MTEKKKRPRDINSLAFQITKEATSESKTTEEQKPVPPGRPGGLKGGKARAKKLTQEERKKIAHIAATARWKKADR